MSMMASQITSVLVVYSTICSGARPKKTSKLCVTGFVRGIHRWPVNSPHKWPVTRKMLPIDVVIMLPNDTKPSITWSSPYIDDLAQDCSNSSALAMELLQFCTYPSICHKKIPKIWLRFFTLSITWMYLKITSAIEVRAWMSNNIPQNTVGLITYPCPNPR